jgi:glycerol kinase
MALQTKDVVDAMRAVVDAPLGELRVDGGASVMDVLLQFQADLLGVPVRRAAVRETTALGAAYLAGLGEGVWDSPQEVGALWRSDREFEPGEEAERSAKAYERWRRGVERSRGWAELD